MSKDEINEFEALLGTPRDRSRHRPRTFVGEVLRAVAEQGGDPRRVCVHCAADKGWTPIA